MSHPRPLRRNQAFLGMHFDLHPNARDTELGADVAEANIADLLRRARLDYVQYDCKGHPGYTGCPTQIGWPSPGIVNDALAAWRKVTREHGVALYIHYSGVVDSLAAAKHPEWAATDADGKPYPRGSTSTFGPYVDELMVPQLIDICRRYDLDGVWADGECWGTQLDWSTWAAEAWTKQTGLAEPPRSEDDEHWQQWKDFHREQFETYLKRWVDALHREIPGIELASNWAYSSFMPKRVDADVDFLSGDFVPLRPVDSARLEARYLANTARPWDLMAWGFTWSPEGKIPRNLKPPVQLMQEAATVLMMGGGFQVYYNPTRRGYIPEPIIQTMEQVAAFCRDRQAICHKNSAVPQVALLLSERSYRQASPMPWAPWAGEYRAINGTLRALLEAHWSVDVLAEWQLEPQLSDWPAVVLPEVTTLDPAFHAAITAYVKGGGRLLLLGDSTARLFPDLVGAAVGEAAVVESYLPYDDGLATVGGPWAELTPTTGQPILHRFDTRDTRTGGRPAAVLNVVGRGQVMTVPGPLGRAFAATHYPGLRQVLSDLVQRLLPDPIVKVSAPPCVDIAVRRSAGGSLTVQLTNVVSLTRWDNAPITDYIPPVGPITLAIQTPRPNRVVWHPEQLEPAWAYRDGRVELTIPTLHLHGVLEIIT